MTLIEVLIAMALLMLVMTTAIAAMYQVAHASYLVRQRTTAAALAWSRVERARHMEFSDIDELVEASPGSVLDANGLQEMDGPYQRQTFVESFTNGLPMKRIRVEVWPRARKSNSFEGEPECVETVITDVALRGTAP